MAATTSNVVAGNWASVRGGKWHLIPGNNPPAFRQEIKSLCGITFEPLNVTGGEAPPTNDHYVCKHCIAAK